jgi:aspartyl/asparaginyl beta-hydroxylase (cupin superfamily)
LTPGFSIKPHVDYDPSYITRFHIPLVTNDDVVMGFHKSNGDHFYHMPADGSVYFFNSGIKHWVDNNGTESRLHLIIDTHGQEDLIDFTECTEIALAV